MVKSHTIGQTRSCHGPESTAPLMMPGSRGVLFGRGASVDWLRRVVATVVLCSVSFPSLSDAKLFTSIAAAKAVIGRRTGLYGAAAMIALGVAQPSHPAEFGRVGGASSPLLEIVQPSGSPPAFHRAPDGSPHMPEQYRSVLHYLDSHPRFPVEIGQFLGQRKLAKLS
ncbi:MAG: hypothetical protein IPL40_13900 [Proteobacteria bacterium]|nr:hypothetical protein [Pseudomonadota bacterium]